MSGTPIQLLIIADMVARLQAMTGPDYTYEFNRVETVKENAITVGDDFLAVVYSGNVRYLNAGMQGVAVTGNKLAREMPFVIGFVFPATPNDLEDPLSIDRDTEAVLMFADIHKCLAAMDHTIIGNTAVEVFFEVDIKDQTQIEAPKVYGELHGMIRFRHNLGDFTTHT